jgi:penicillin-binding protein 1A
VGRDGLKGIGGDRLLDTVRKVGIDSDIVVNPTMVLGSNGVTVMEMAMGYGSFMTGGERVHRHGITQITDKAGDILFDWGKDAPPKERVFSEETAGVMNRIMSQIPEWGTGRRAALEGIRSAGKTGTTQAYRDAWYVGYTGNYVAAVWFGNDNYQPTRRLTGGRLPAMTWNKFMTYAHQNIERRPIPFIENPFPGSEGGEATVAASSDEENADIPVRPKLLSQDAENALNKLETLLRNAKPLDRKDKLASNPNPNPS